MGQQLSQEQLKLYTAIDGILWSEWDPIGVFCMDGPRDEYHAYLLHVFSLTLRSVEPHEIAEYLEWVVVERMGLCSNAQYSLQIARKIIQEKTACGL